jgi:hypothetical protein
VAEALRLLESFTSRVTQFAELAVEHEHNGASVLALIANGRGWLMYMREPGDPGFSTRNPSSDSPADATLPFVLGNGQLDQYPARWTYGVDKIYDALRSFISTETFPSEITWHNDSGDGTSPRNTDTGSPTSLP